MGVQVPLLLSFDPAVMTTSDYGMIGDRLVDLGVEHELACLLVDVEFFHLSQKLIPEYSLLLVMLGPFREVLLLLSNHMTALSIDGRSE